MLTSMDDKRIMQLTGELINSLPGISGVNNHQGSKATSDERTMRAVLKEIKRQGLFFVDSNTYAKSLGDKLAAGMGVPTGRNNIFLDNSTNEDEIIKKSGRLRPLPINTAAPLPFAMRARIPLTHGSRL